MGPDVRGHRQLRLDNKVMAGTVNANREYFELGVKDLAHCEAQFAGWLESLLTHPVSELPNFRQLFDTLSTAGDARKVFCEVSPH